ncbi:hypothetical protein PGB90_005347 [Kerria lacca]
MSKGKDIRSYFSVPSLQKKPRLLDDREKTAENVDVELEPKQCSSSFLHPEPPSQNVPQLQPTDADSRQSPVISFDNDIGDALSLSHIIFCSLILYVDLFLFFSDNNIFGISVGTRLHFFLRSFRFCTFGFVRFRNFIIEIEVDGKTDGKTDVKA